jgi:hypothetical protein
VRGDRHVWHDAIAFVGSVRTIAGLTPQVLNRRNQPEIDAPFVKEIGTARWNVVAKVEPGRFREAVHVRSRVQVPDGTKPQHG